MSESRAGADGLARTHSTANRPVRAWRVLPPERRLAAIAALGLFATLFLPWYQETVIASGAATNLRSASASLTGWGAFSFVEAAVLLVAAGVLVLLFYRAEGRAFHVPGGDGGVITAAGLWTVVLIVWRMFDKEGTSGHGQYATTSGIEWGIFIALGVAALLTYAGSRIRRAHEPEPPLPGEVRPADVESSPPTRPRRTKRTPAAGRPPEPPRVSAPRRSWSYDPEPLALSDRPEAQAPIRPHRARVARDSQGKRGLNFADLDAITFDEPPEAPTVRRGSDPGDPAVVHPDPDDQLTTGLDSDDQLTTRLDSDEQLTTRLDSDEQLTTGPDPDE